MNGGTIYSTRRGIYNEKTGSIEVNGGTIMSESYATVENKGTGGNIVINGGVFKTWTGRATI